MKHFFQNADTTVKEMWIGVALWGIFGELVTVWFVEDRIGCLLGILIGCLMAAAGIWHMWKVLDTALDLREGAPKYVQTKSLLRYGVFVILFAVLMVSEAANPLTAFLGLMGMKAAAYLQPAVHKFRERRR